MTARTVEGNEFDLTSELLNDLKMKLKGPVLMPGDQGYDECRSIWNGMVEKKPALIIRCLGTADVIESIKFARKNNLLLCIKGGGHNIGGLATTEGGLMLDMSLMRGVWVDKDKRIAHTQAGCLLGDVDRESQLHGLAAVLGFVSQTGVAGLTLGGGFGYLTRRWGWTADNVTGMDMVTSDGRLVHASDDENPDLFWGLRGGGGNFGVVTAIDYKLYPVGPEIVGGITAWPASESSKVLELYKSIAEEAPLELTMVVLIRPAPPAPWIPKEWHGKMIIALLACYSGDPEKGEKIVIPIKSFGTPIADILVRRPYAQMQALLDTANPKGRRYYWKSEYLQELKPELMDKVIEHGTAITSPFSAVILFQIGGALNLLEEDYSPVGNRNARYLFNITSSWEKPGEDESNIKWARNAWEDMKQFSTGGTYINFLNQDEDFDRTKDALGKAVLRLAEIKTKWDPDNLFRTNRNIKPRKERLDELLNE
jgi:hypothetical protein